MRRERGGRVDGREVGECKVLKPLHPEGHALQRLQLLRLVGLHFGVGERGAAVVVDVVGLVEARELEELCEEGGLGGAAAREGREARTLEHVRVEQHRVEKAARRQLGEQVDDELERALEVADHRAALACLGSGGAARTARAACCAVQLVGRRGILGRSGGRRSGGGGGVRLAIVVAVVVVVIVVVVVSFDLLLGLLLGLAARDRKYAQKLGKHAGHELALVPRRRRRLCQLGLLGTPLRQKLPGAAELRLAGKEALQVRGRERLPHRQ